MITSLSLLETACIAACIVLGTGLLVCAAVIVVRIALSVARSSAWDVAAPRTAAATRRKRRQSSSDVYADIYRAVLEAQATEVEPAAASPAETANDPLPIFPKAERRLDVTDAGLPSVA